MIDKAILKINPDAEFVIGENDVNQITWENGTTPIPVVDIQAQIPVVEQEIADAETKKINDKNNLIIATPFLFLHPSFL